MTKQVVYINPTFSINGDGTTWTQAGSPGGVGAFNAVGTGVFGGTLDLTHFWKDSTVYLLAAETTYASAITVYNCIGAELGTYDPSDGSRIQDNTRHAKVTSSSGQCVNLGTAGASRNSFTVDNIDMRALARTTSSGFNYGFACSAAAHNTEVNVTIRRCIADGYVAITGSGAGFIVEDTAIGGYSDGLSLITTRARAERCSLLDLPIDATSYDSITFQTVDANTVESYIARNNNLLSARYSSKQGVYFYNGNILATHRPTGVMLIEGNIISNRNQCILSQFGAVTVRRNKILRAYEPNYLDGSGGDPRAITLLGSDNWVVGNAIEQSPFARGISLGNEAGTNYVLNNQFDGIESGLSDYSGAPARNTVCRNNRFTRSLKTDAVPNADRWFLNTSSQVTLTVSGNQFYAPDLDDANETALFKIGGTDKTQAQYISTVEPGAVVTAPQVDSDYRLTTGAPTIWAGTHTGYMLDKDGRMFNNPPSIGAYEYVPPRGTR